MSEASSVFMTGMSSNIDDNQPHKTNVHIAWAEKQKQIKEKDANLVHNRTRGVIHRLCYCSN